MVMMDHAKHLSEPLRWTRAGRIAVLASVAALIAAVVALAVIAVTDAPPHRAGCIEVTFASTLGAARMDACGARARQVCATPAESPAAEAHGQLRDACRKAGLPYDSRSGRA